MIIIIIIIAIISIARYLIDKGEYTALTEPLERYENSALLI